MKRICANLSNHVWYYVTSFSKELLCSKMAMDVIMLLYNVCTFHSATQLAYSGNKEAR